MSSPNLRELRSDQVPTARDWNELVRLVQSMTQITGTAFGDVGVTRGVGGLQVLDGKLRRHWGKITSRGTGNAYAHNSAYPVGDGTFIDLPSNTDNPFGTSTVSPAREVNGRVDFDSSLPLYKELWPDEQGGGWLFDAGLGGLLTFDEYNAVTSVSLTADNTLTDIMSLSIPAAGTYLITMNLVVSGYQTTLSAVTYDNIRVVPIHFTTGTSLNGTPSAFSAPVSATNIIFKSSVSWSHVVTFDAAYTIKTQAERVVNSGGVWAANPSTGVGSYSYTRIA